MNAELSVEVIDRSPLAIAGAEELMAGHDLVSPFVWSAHGTTHLLVCAIPHALGTTDPTGEIYAGTMDQPGQFRMCPSPAITPGLEFADLGGVEDPAVVVDAMGGTRVFYTGIGADRQTSALMVAQGAELSALHKRPVKFDPPEGQRGLRRAVVRQGADGSWRMFYEFIAHGAARIGCAVAGDLDGPWEPAGGIIGPRSHAWDAGHVSTGPIVNLPGAPPVMFYNGACGDGSWGVGWIAFDENLARVVGRCDAPILGGAGRGEGIFAASCVTADGATWLYYAPDDGLLGRARVERVRVTG